MVVLVGCPEKFCVDLVFTPNMDDGLGQNVVILVVGNVQDEKSAVVDCLTKIGTWDEQTTAGVRVLTHKFGVQVIDTTPLRNVQGKSPTAIARRWISQNSLRRILLGKMVFVVCVVTYAIKDEPCDQVVFTNYNCWLDVMGLIFGHHKDILILAFMEANGLCTHSLLKHCVRRHGFPPKNVHFYDSRMDDVTKFVVEGSIRKTLPTFCGLGDEIVTSERVDFKMAATFGTPFHWKLPRQVSSGRDRFGPWGPERVILFGRTGSGKSTLAQMLTMGKLDRKSTKFKTSSSIRGGTTGIESGDGRGWYVVDTPGFGEPESEASTVTTHVAQNKVKKFVEWEEGTFSHYLFVLKKDRIDDLEVRLWRFFKLLFGEKLNHHFSIVISDADNAWLERNVSHLRKSFEGCNSFLTAEFPLGETNDDEELDRDYQELRTDSLRALEEELASLARSDLHCAYGEHSKMHMMNERDRAYIDSSVDKSTVVIIDFIEKVGLISIMKSIDDLVYVLSRSLSSDTVQLEPE